MVPSLPRISRRDLSYFFFSQHFSDGLRTTLAILLPALVGAQWGDFAAGITISTGAVCVSATDGPGPAKHKRNGMLAGLGLVFAVSILTALAAPHRWLCPHDAAGVGCACGLSGLGSATGDGTYAGSPAGAEPSAASRSAAVARG
jgi:uncharacterized membrane protein YccC